MSTFLNCSCFKILAKEVNSALLYDIKQNAKYVNFVSKEVLTVDVSK